MKIEGKAIPVDRSNVDTDQIIPAGHLTTISKKGLGQFLFESLPGWADLVKKHPDAQIVLTRDNFGCGSSREHAAWAILDKGYKAVIASSFARIFEENCYNNGIVPVRLGADEVDALFKTVASDPGTKLAIDVPGETLTVGGKSYKFALDPLKKQFLLEGGFLKYMESLIPEIRRWDGQRPQVF